MVMASCNFKPWLPPSKWTFQPKIQLFFKSWLAIISSPDYLQWTFQPLNHSYTLAPHLKCLAPHLKQILIVFLKNATNMVMVSCNLRPWLPPLAAPCAPQTWQWAPRLAQHPRWSPPHTVPWGGRGPRSYGTVPTPAPWPSPAAKHRE